VVENNLLKRVKGYCHEEKHLKPDENGKLRVVRIVEKEVPPDPEACMDWLCNRIPERWKRAGHSVLSESNNHLIGE